MVKRTHGASDRAERFPVHIPVRYRIPHSSEWFDAWTENVSRSGVLFRTLHTFEPTTTLDVRLEFPPVSREGVHIEAVCQGEVVRVEQAYQGGISPAIAIAIHHYRLAQKRPPN
jgi:hypothetical protein